MRFLLTLLGVVWLGLVGGCGRGHEGRRARPSGTGDPSAIFDELKALRPGAATELQTAVADDADDEDKEAEKKSAKDTKPK